MIIHKRNYDTVGLGNQLFQIAATIAHAKKMGVKACFPKWKYNNYLLHPINDTLDPEYDNIFDGKIHEDYYWLKFPYRSIHYHNQHPNKDQ